MNYLKSFLTYNENLSDKLKIEGHDNLKGNYIHYFTLKFMKEKGLIGRKLKVAYFVLEEIVTFILYLK